MRKQKFTDCNFQETQNAFDNRGDHPYTNGALLFAQLRQQGLYVDTITKVCFSLVSTFYLKKIQKFPLFNFQPMHCRNVAKAPLHQSHSAYVAIDIEEEYSPVSLASKRRIQEIFDDF